MATYSDIDLGKSATLVASTVDTLNIEAADGVRGRIIVVKNLNPSGVIALTHGSAPADPTTTGDVNYIGPYDSLPIELGGQAYQVKLISATACAYLLNVQTVLA